MRVWYTSASIVLLGSTPALAQVTQRVSVSSSGSQASDWSNGSALSADARFIAFSSPASDLVPGDTNGGEDIFVRDRVNGTTERASVNSSNVQQNNGSTVGVAISSDGRHVAFCSPASNLVQDDTNLQPDIFVRDRTNGITERVSTSSSGVQGDRDCLLPSMSADARYVVFGSRSTHLVIGDTNDRYDIFLRDRLLGITERVSVDSNGQEADADSIESSVSDDGRYVVFTSTSTNLVPADTNGCADVFVRDRLAGTTQRVSVDSSGIQGDADSGRPAIAGNGRYVAFGSAAGNLVGGDTNGHGDVFVRDLAAGTTERVSVSSTAQEGWTASDVPSISADGRFVAFSSHAGNLDPGDTNHTVDTFVRDRLTSSTERVSVASDGTEGQGPSQSMPPGVSPDGRWVAFSSLAPNLVPADTNGIWDVFVRDRYGGPDFTVLCDPGLGNVMSCPCSNPPSGPGRGCDNSSGTGGAVLAASGGTYLSSDTLVFTASDERPTALSIATQWTGSYAAGASFGMGVRCTSGTFKRLYTKQASSGSITAPDFPAGDPQVSVRSAALGDPLVPGDSRWYFVYYRDPVVLGGCPRIRTFNCTQTGQVTWAP